MTPEVSDAIDRYSYAMQLSATLIRAISTVESSLDPWKVRYEPSWKYAFNTQKYADELGITEQTERSLQSHSWGLMQIMGSVAREHGYTGPLQRLSELDLGLFHGCFHIVKLHMRYNDPTDIIAAYNAGSAIKGADGKYVNQNYVDRVLALMK